MLSTAEERTHSVPLTRLHKLRSRATTRLPRAAWEMLQDRMTLQILILLVTAPFLT